MISGLEHPQIHMWPYVPLSQWGNTNILKIEDFIRQASHTGHTCRYIHIHTYTVLYLCLCACIVHVSCCICMYDNICVCVCMYVNVCVCMCFSHLHSKKDCTLQVLHALCLASNSKSTFSFQQNAFDDFRSRTPVCRPICDSMYHCANEAIHTIWKLRNIYDRHLIKVIHAIHTHTFTYSTVSVSMCLYNAYIMLYVYVWLCMCMYMHVCICMCMYVFFGTLIAKRIALSKCCTLNA